MAVIERMTRPLVDGERLTLDEFLRRWEDQPDLKRAELLEGRPTCLHWLALPMDHTISCLRDGPCAIRPAPTGCAGGNEGAWLMRGSAPQSDVALRILPEYGGQSHEEKASRQARLNWLEVAGSSAPL